MNVKKKNHPDLFQKEQIRIRKLMGRVFHTKLNLSHQERNRKCYSISKQKEGIENRHGTKTLCLENQFASLKSYFVKVISAFVYSRSIIP